MSYAVEKATSVSLPGTTAADVKQVRDRIRGFADAGVRHFILSLRPPFERAVLRTFAKEVVPEFREA